MPLIISASMLTMDARSLIIKVFVCRSGTMLPWGDRKGLRTEARYSASACSSWIMQTIARSPDEVVFSWAGEKLDSRAVPGEESGQAYLPRGSSHLLVFR